MTNQNDRDEELRFRLGMRNLLFVNGASTPSPYTAFLQGCEDSALNVLSGISSRPAVNLDFAFFDSPSINGRAFRDVIAEKEYRVATISTGAILYLHDFFLYLMSRSDILPTIGLAAGERNLPFTFSPPRTYPPVEALVSRKLVKSIVPIDLKRRDFAANMATAAATFLVLHEIGHCINGHLTNGAFNLDEIDGSTCQSPSATLRSHTLEMDADACATNYLLRQILGGEKDPDFIWTPQLKGAPPHKALYPCFLAIELLFLIMARPEALSMEQDGLMNGKHPHPYMRTHFVRVTVATICDALGIEEEDEAVRQLAVKSAFDAVAIWNCITGTKASKRVILLDDDSLSDGYSRARKYMNQLLDCWDEIRPELEPNAMVRLAPSKSQLSSA